jgi:integrase
MSILAECPQCHIKQAVKNKKCSCGADLDKLKRASKIKYHIQYRDREGKQFKKYIGYSLDDAKTEDGSIRKQIKEGNTSMIPKKKITFNELSGWYLKLERVKVQAYHKTLTYNLDSFCKVFGNEIVTKIKPADIENFQAAQKKEGLSDSYIDQQVGAAKTVINKAFDNDLVGLDAVRSFKKVKKLLKRNSNARDKIITKDQFKAIMKHISPFTAPIVATAYYTGMRREEILSLTWDKVDMKGRVIRLEAKDTKDDEARVIPICDELHKMFQKIPRALHNNHVFLYHGERVTDIRTSLQTACAKAGITYGREHRDGITFHDLRHTFNTNMRKAGVQESVIMEITGHSTREMFDRYNTIDLDDTKQAMERMTSFLASRRA